jgi:acetylglutamate/LysW-gamma-L-alpha-aminoadipate kinase
MIIVKIGGGKEINLEGIVGDLAQLEERFIVVHGANALRDQLARQLGQPRQVVTSVSGYESVLSDHTTIDLMMMAYAGLRNKRLVELCQQRGINAVGLSGLDGQAIRARRNRGIKIMEAGRKKMVRDLSGKPSEVNRDFLTLLLEHGYTPVLTVPILDEKNCAVNTENDDVVRLLQESFDAERVIQLIEAPGLLKDSDNPESVIPSLTAPQVAEWEGRVKGRMKRKLLALKKLVSRGRVTIHISDGRTASPVRDALNGAGTRISS